MPIETEDGLKKSHLCIPKHWELTENGYELRRVVDGYDDEPHFSPLYRAAYRQRLLRQMHFSYPGGRIAIPDAVDKSWEPQPHIFPVYVKKPEKLTSKPFFFS